MDKRFSGSAIGPSYITVMTAEGSDSQVLDEEHLGICLAEPELRGYVCEPRCGVQELEVASEDNEPSAFWDRFLPDRNKDRAFCWISLTLTNICVP